MNHTHNLTLLYLIEDYDQDELTAVISSLLKKNKHNPRLLIPLGTFCSFNVM